MYFDGFHSLFFILLLLCICSLFVGFPLSLSVVGIHLFVWSVIYEIALNHFSLDLGGCVFGTFVMVVNKNFLL